MFSHWIMSGPLDCSPPRSSVLGISQARILEWVVTSFSRRSSQPRDWTLVSCIGRRVLYHWATREALANYGLRCVCMCVCVFVCVLSCFSRVHSVRAYMDCSPLGSSVHGILEARIMEWVAIPSSRGASWPRDMPYHKITLIPLQTGYQLKKSHQLAIIKFTTTNYTKIDTHEQCSVDKKWTH